MPSANGGAKSRSVTPPPPSAISRTTPLQQRRNWRPGLLSVGVFVVVASALAGVLLFDSITNTEEVLVAATDLQRGQVIGGEDVRVADISLAPGVNALRYEDRAFLGGEDSGQPVRELRGFVPAGSILTPDNFQVQGESLSPEEALIGVRLESGDYPSMLSVGDRVELFVVGNGDQSARRLGEAEVWTVWQAASEDEPTEDLIADLVVDRSIRPEALQAHSEAALRLTVVRDS